MSDNPCPACRYPNRPTAWRCEACGAALAEPDTVPSTLAHSGPPVARVDTRVGALWLHDLGLPDIAVPQARFSSLAAAAPGPTPVAGSAPLPLLYVLPQPRPAPPLAPSMPPAEALPTEGAAEAASKVARRAAVRRARLASASPLQAVSDVMVMDAAVAARQQLDELLAGLGFRVRAVATLAQAALQAGVHPFAAVFVVVPPGAIDGAVHDLFERVREVCRGAKAPPAVRVLLAARWSPVDRVRAELTGCEATLALPVNRSDIARVLDANGVVLPRDPRRG